MQSASFGMQEATRAAWVSAPARLAWDGRCHGGAGRHERRPLGGGRKTKKHAIYAKQRNQSVVTLCTAGHQL